jgi:hypothetical protein
VFSCRSGKEEKKTKFCLKNSRKLKIYKTNTPQKFLTNKCKMMYIKNKNGQQYDENNNRTNKQDLFFFNFLFFYASV